MILTNCLKRASSSWQVFYSAAGFWKLNTAFLDPAHSCGTILIVQLVGHWLPEALTPTPIMKQVARAAPVAVVLGEVMIAPLVCPM